MQNAPELSEVELDCLDQCRKMEAECRSLWIRAIDFSPRLASYCPHWHDFTPPEWAILVAHNRDFINIAPLHLLGWKEWYIILEHQIALIDKCTILEEFPEASWNALQRKYPWIEKN